ncbi:Uncharacterised protein [Mycobacterium tuberculosis]|nr:Uncharacterised protein [Mycobacterium tuberculosis]
MAEAGRSDVVDLSEIDLAALRPADGSVIGEALARVRSERDDGGWGYASFLNEPGDRTRRPPAAVREEAE